MMAACAPEIPGEYSLEASLVQEVVRRFDGVCKALPLCIGDTLLPKPPSLIRADERQSRKPHKTEVVYKFLLRAVNLGKRGESARLPRC